MPKTVYRPYLNPKIVLIEAKETQSNIEIGPNFNFAVEHTLQINV